MIEKLRSMAIFVTVVDEQTFRAAAKQLGLAPSRVSETISALEKDLGVTLLYRSTRQLSLTKEGHILYEKAQHMMQAAESGLDAISMVSDQPSGELRVTAPAFAIQTGLMDMFSEFSKSNPKVNLKLNFSDTTREIIKEGFDVGIRAGWLQDSELMSRNIGHAERILVASPEYVASKPTAIHPKDLEDWDWIHFSVRPERAELVSDSGDKELVTCNFKIEVDSANALYEFAVRGSGVTQIPESLAKRGFNRGELVRVLPGWSVEPLKLQATWADRSGRKSLALIFVRYLAENSDRL